jgi:hypothetical protein
MGEGSWVGLDVHARSVIAGVLDAETGELRSWRAPTLCEEAVVWLQRLPGPVRVAYEAGPTGYGLARACAAAPYAATTGRANKSHSAAFASEVATEEPEPRAEDASILTRDFSAAIRAWVATHECWDVELEVDVGRYVAERTGRIDFVVRRPNRPPLAIELDRTDKQKSVAKLVHATTIGWDALWVRWGFHRKIEVPPSVYVVELPFRHKTSAFLRSGRNA